MSGAELEIRLFCCSVQGTTGVSNLLIVQVTTAEAEGHLWSAGLTPKRRKARRDRVAAQILFQTYLDAGCPEETNPGALDR